MMRDWDYAWDRARAQAQITSPEYDDYRFRPSYLSAVDPSTPSRSWGLQAEDVIADRKPGRYSVRCPAHEDGSPSLGIRIEEDGKVLINCLAGCETADVLKILGLRWSDLRSV
jgi:hypothetical protein